MGKKKLKLKTSVFAVTYIDNPEIEDLVFKIINCLNTSTSNARVVQVAAEAAKEIEKSIKRRIT